MLVGAYLLGGPHPVSHGPIARPGSLPDFLHGPPVNSQSNKSRCRTWLLAPFMTVLWY